MSVFSKIRKSKKAAKEHKAKEKEKDPEAVVKVSYKHTPTHAAIDALSGAPSSWNQEDRPKIKEQHKKRSELAISRTESTLSSLAFAKSAVEISSQASPLPRNSSYSSYNSADVYHANNTSRAGEPKQSKRASQRGHSYHDSGLGPSPLASNVHSEDVSPVVSSGNSTNSTRSSDHLEIPANARHHFAQRQQPTVYGAQDIFDRLHTSTTRKLGEAPLFDGPPPASKFKTSAATAAPTAPKEKPKKQTWSMLGRKNTAVVA